MKNGLQYLFTIYGFGKCTAISSTCLTFSLLLAGGDYSTSSALLWVFIAFAIAFSVSSLLLTLRMTGLLDDAQGRKGYCSFDGFDLIFSAFFLFWCIAASATFLAEFSKWSNRRTIASYIFSIFSIAAYGFDLRNLRVYFLLDNGMKLRPKHPSEYASRSDAPQTSARTELSTVKEEEETTSTPPDVTNTKRRQGSPRPNISPSAATKDPMMVQEVKARDGGAVSTTATYLREKAQRPTTSRHDFATGLGETTTSSAAITIVADVISEGDNND